EALVVDHILPSHADRGVADVGNRFRRIADVLIKRAAFIGRWRRKRQESTRVQVERFFANILRWPGVEMPPLIGARFENVGLREIVFFLFLTVLLSCVI